MESMNSISLISDLKILSRNKRPAYIGQSKFRKYDLHSTTISSRHLILILDSLGFRFLLRVKLVVQYGGQNLRLCDVRLPFLPGVRVSPWTLAVKSTQPPESNCRSIRWLFGSRCGGKFHIGLKVVWTGPSLTPAAKEFVVVQGI